MQAGAYSRILLYEDVNQSQVTDPETPRLTPAQNSIIRERYRLVARVPGPHFNGLYLYEPRETAPISAEGQMSHPTHSPAEQALAAYHAVRFTPDPRREAVWRVLCSYLQRWVEPAGELLDLGAGYGEFSRSIRSGQKWALDTNPELTAYWLPDTRPLIQSALEPLPLPTGGLSDGVRLQLL